VANKYTAKDVVEALRKRYWANPGNGPRWVHAAEVRNAAGFSATRSCDFVAIDTWPSKSLAIHGHEIKCSRADWLNELKQPEKSEAFKKHCDYWWLVISDASIVKDGELPEDWGLLVLDGRGIVEKKRAPKLTKDGDFIKEDGYAKFYEPIPRSFAVALLRRVQDMAYNEGLRVGRENAEISARRKQLDIVNHNHGSGSEWHTHAWGTTKHDHILRAVCGREECKDPVVKTHNIHSAPKEDLNG
jgi:hypothetical protein